MQPIEPWVLETASYKGRTFDADTLAEIAAGRMETAARALTDAEREALGWPARRDITGATPVAYRAWLAHGEDFAEWVEIEVNDFCTSIGKVWARALQAGDYKAIELRLDNGQVVRVRKRVFDATRYPFDTLGAINDCTTLTPEDVMYADACRIVKAEGSTGPSWLQRRMGLSSWGTAAHLIIRMMRDELVRDRTDTDDGLRAYVWIGPK